MTRYENPEPEPEPVSRREGKLSKRRQLMKKHARNLGEIYRDTIKKRLKPQR